MLRRTSIIVLTIVLYMSTFLGCNNTFSDQSMYYADTISLASLGISDYDSIWSEYTNIVLQNESIYLKNPLKLSPDSIHTKLFIAVDGKIKEIPLKIKCWIDDEYELKEINPTNNFLKKVERYYYNHFQDSITRKKHFVCPILYNQDGETYYVNDGKLQKVNRKNEILNLSEICLHDVMYNQMITNQKFGIIRSGNTIIFSDDSLRSWTEIYVGPRQIKESMFWNEQDSSLLFSQYTPGKVRNRHYILKYDYGRNSIDTVFTFFTEKEFINQKLTPCARHIHVLTVDPYTGWIFVGTGDTDNESAIYVSKDKGTSFNKIGGGKQVWRTLSMIFTDKYIYWNTDSDSPQYLSRVSRNALDSIPLNPNSISRYPLFNSALWNTIQYDDITLMSSNVEGALYDNNRRIYGIKFNGSGVPIVYNLWDEPGETWSSQLFPIGVDKDGQFQFYDTQNMKYRYFILLDKNGKRL